MQQADETFLTTTQEPRKLSIAISRYFSGELTEPDLKERYEKFLRQRSRAAMLQIIKDGSFQEMVKLADAVFSPMPFTRRPSSKPPTPAEPK